MSLILSNITILKIKIYHYLSVQDSNKKINGHCKDEYLFDFEVILCRLVEHTLIGLWDLSCLETKEDCIRARNMTI
jgi:hypothetical protein